jgi:hypothetical protein
MFGKRISAIRLFVALGAIVILAASISAFAAGIQNGQDPYAVGQGNRTVTGYVLSATDWTWNDSQESVPLVSLEFTLAPTDPGTAADWVHVRLVDNGDWFKCDIDGNAVTCTFGGAALSVAQINTLEVLAGTSEVTEPEADIDLTL